MSYSSLKALEMAIKKEVENSLRSDVAENAVDIHKKLKKDNVYSRSESEWYDRTHELLNSSVANFNDNKSTSDKLELEIYDETNDTYMPSGHPSWLSKSSRNNKNRYIPGWINDGHGGLGVEYEETNYIEKAREKINKTSLDVLKKSLSKKGIDCV